MMDEKQLKIEILKNKLRSTDYFTLKYTEGQISEEEFQIAKVQRAGWRKELEELEKQ